MQSKLRALAKEVGIDWSRAIYGADGATAFEHDFDLTPEDFLEFARKDMRLDTVRGRVNALSNAKRCIDCATDRFLQATNLLRPITEHQDIVTTYIRNSLEFPLPAATNIKLRLLHALGIAPSNLVTRVRALRDMLEHEYKAPGSGDVEDALEVAQLFFGCIERNLMFTDSLAIGSGLKNGRPRHYLMVWYKREGHFHLLRPREITPVSTIGPDRPEYLALLKLCIFSWQRRNIQVPHDELMRCIDIPVQPGIHKPKVIFA